MLDRNKILSFLDMYSSKPLLANSDEGDFLPAICQVQLGNHKEAKYLFEKSAKAMFLPPMFWKGSGQPHWLVAVCILSGRIDLYADVGQELDLYGTVKKDNYFLFLSDSLMELLLPSGRDIKLQLERLIGKPKFKETYLSGLTLQAILNQDQVVFDETLGQLLLVHEGKAKRGDLRWTAEGLLCLPAMALAYVARKRGLRVNLTNDYLNLGYLEYLLA